jgi:hypothetical protein
VEPYLKKTKAKNKQKNWRQNNLINFEPCLEADVPESPGLKKKMFG